jgi:hypothetical protein
MNTVMLLAALALRATMTQAVACDGNKEANKTPVIVACAISDCTIIWDQPAYKTEPSEPFRLRSGTRLTRLGKSRQGGNA